MSEQPAVEVVEVAWRPAPPAAHAALLALLFTSDQQATSGDTFTREVSPRMGATSSRRRQA